MDQFSFEQILSSSQTPLKQPDPSAKQVTVSDEGANQRTEEIIASQNTDEVQISNLPGIELPSHGSDRVLNYEHSRYFSAVNARIEGIERKAQGLIDKVNVSRKRDLELMTNFREKLLMKVSELCHKLEDQLYDIYEQDNKVIQDKMQELSTIMRRNVHVSTELQEACHNVVSLYKGLCMQPEL
ncbi:synaptonemal complex central element protein 2 [Acipenser ruthenus]|uniref:synaptonemal complex central element protein 2 n=1 Tax=Acipenser ruthenus TaxID=7906 RepID=UPI00145C187D|nr:synaptonemal complex central element protein 2 [Acipenser ruthenus]XP_058863938.1 synaptonemal complex central element protein 2 [Acipenser ruthenus]